MPRKPRLTKEQLPHEADKQLRENARGLLQKWFIAVDKKVEQGDTKTIEMVGRMFQFDKGPGGVTIFNQHLQVNGEGGEPGERSGRIRSFDQLVSRLEDRHNARLQLAAPVENSDDLDTEAIEDGEVEDPEPEPADEE